MGAILRAWPGSSLTCLSRAADASVLASISLRGLSEVQMALSESEVSKHEQNDNHCPDKPDDAIHDALLKRLPCMNSRHDVKLSARTCSPIAFHAGGVPRCHTQHGNVCTVAVNTAWMTGSGKGDRVVMACRICALQLALALEDAKFLRYPAYAWQGAASPANGCTPSLLTDQLS